MSKVDRKQFGAAAKPKLKPADTNGADLVVVTVHDAWLHNGDFGAQWVFNMGEFPERTFYLNKRGVDRICDALGEDSEDWEGKRVPLVKQQEENPSEQRRLVDVYQVAEAKEWPKLLKQYDAEVRKAKGGRSAK